MSKSRLNIISPIELGDVLENFRLRIKEIRDTHGNTTLNTELFKRYSYVETYSFLDGYNGYSDFASHRFGGQFITSGNNDYRKFLIIKLSLLPKNYINRILEYACDKYECGGGNRNIEFNNFLNNDFFEELGEYKWLWKYDKLNEQVENWKKNNITPFTEESQIFVKISNTKHKEIAQQKLCEYASPKTKKYVALLLNSTLKSPIEFNLSASEFGMAINTLKKKGYLSSNNNKDVAKWVTKSFKILNRSIISRETNKYKYPRFRTILDIFNENKKALQLTKTNILKAIS